MLVGLVVGQTKSAISEKANISLYLACVTAAGYAVAKQLTLTALILDSEVLMEFLGVHALERPGLLGMAALSCMVLAI